MPPSFRQSTALAAMIAVAAPQVGLAQARIPQDRIEAHRAEMAAGQPGQAARLESELAAGLEADALTCAEPATAQPCPPDMALLTPQGIPVVLGEDGSILLAPQEAANGQPAAETGTDTEADTAAAPQADTAEGEAAGEAGGADADAGNAAAADAAAGVPEAAADAGDSAADPADATPEDAAMPAEAPATPEPPAAGDTQTAGTEAAADMPAADAGAADAATPEAATDETAIDDTAPEETVPAPAATAADGTPDADELARRLAGEAGDATDATDAAPAGDALAEGLTDAGADAVAADEAPPETPPEARAEEPDAAALLAAEAEAPVAAALDMDDDAQSLEAGEAITVTEADARSSAEDFATSVAAAAKPAQQADSSGNRDRDLARALLAGLAGYAVGQAVGDHGQVALNSGDRVVITRQDGSQQVLKDDSALMFQPGAQVQTQNFDDGSSRIVVMREDGSRVVTIRDANLRVLRRTLILADGSEVKLIDDSTTVAPVAVTDLPPPARPLPPPSLTDEAALRRALEVEAATDRRFTLGQIRDIAGVRALVAPVSIDAITFDTGSAAIKPDQARQLASLGKVIADYIRANPGEMFLVEGYTDTVGAEAMNLALSDRRAESLALALTEYFNVPPENLVVQGYGERFLKIPAEGDIRENRRVAVRRITDLLARN